jgi:hypothetical protein
MLRLFPLPSRPPIHDLLLPVFSPTTIDDSTMTSISPLDTQDYPTPLSVHLPLEVVLNIIEEAHYDDRQLDARAAFLKRCALVCRDWSIPALI